MTIASVNNRNDYTGNDSTPTYNYTFRLLLEVDLKVIVREIATNVETVLVQDTDYTISGVGDLSGGTITLIDAGQAWISASSNLDTGYRLTLRRVVQLLQNTDVRNQGDFYPEIHEDAFDRAVMADQQQQDDLDRSVKLPESVAPNEFDTTIPADIIGNSALALVSNATGDGFAVGPSTADIESANSAAASAIAAAANASQSETNAAASAATAASEASAAAGSSGTAVAAAGNATTSANLAQDWAIKMDGPVSGGEFSAKYWADQAAGAGAGSVVTTFPTEAIGGGGEISHTDNSRQYRRVQGISGPQTTSTTPFGTVTTDFSDGQTYIIVGVSDTNTLTIPYADIDQGALVNGDAVLKRGRAITLMYDSTLVRFVEISRNF